MANNKGSPLTEEYVNYGTVYATTYNNDIGGPNKPSCSSTSENADFNFRQWGDTFILYGTRTITNSNDIGYQGEICYDENYIYVCVANNTWKRVAIASW